MSVNVGGKKFIDYPDDVITVDGQRVKKIFADGEQVYPSNIDGTYPGFYKPHGKLIQEFHYTNQGDYRFKDIWADWISWLYVDGDVEFEPFQADWDWIGIPYTREYAQVFCIVSKNYFTATIMRFVLNSNANREEGAPWPGRQILETKKSEYVRTNRNNIGYRLYVWFGTYNSGYSMTPRKEAKLKYNYKCKKEYSSDDYDIILPEWIDAHSKK